MGDRRSQHKVEGYKSQLGVVLLSLLLSSFQSFSSLRHSVLPSYLTFQVPFSNFHLFSKWLHSLPSSPSSPLLPPWLPVPLLRSATSPSDTLARLPTSVSVIIHRETRLDVCRCTCLMSAFSSSIRPGWKRRCLRQREQRLFLRRRRQQRHVRQQQVRPERICHQHCQRQDHYGHRC